MSAAFCVVFLFVTVGAAFADVGEPLFLTPYINSGDTITAKELAAVTKLTPSIESYSGYFTVDEECGSNMFFWFFPSKHLPATDPVTLWLSGGPGTSSLFGELVENGPYELTLDGTLKLREHSWNEESSIIYLDNPVGTGYSFAKGLECYSTNQSHVAANILNALKQFFLLFPELSQNQFFLAGESYAGKYIPALASAIKNSPSPRPNLKGMIIGNPLIDPVHQINLSAHFYQLGLIDRKTMNAMAEQEQNIRDAIHEGNYTKAAELREDLFDNVFSKKTGYTSYYNMLHIKGDKKPDYKSFVDTPEFREAVHVGNSTWHSDGIDVSTLLFDDIMRSVSEYVTEMFGHIRTVIYFGQLDLRIPYTPSMEFVEKADFFEQSEYYYADRWSHYVDNELAFYSKSAWDFAEVLLRNAGHIAPWDQPLWSLELFNAFLKGDIPIHDIGKKGKKDKKVYITSKNRKSN